jgi:hypothetical protein
LLVLNERINKGKKGWDRSKKMFERKKREVPETQYQDITLGSIEIALEKFYPGMTLAGMGQIWNKIGGKNGFERLLGGKSLVVDKWQEDDGVLYLTLPLVNDGKTGSQWIKHLENMGKHIWDYAAGMFLEEGFKPMVGISQIAVLKGSFFKDDERTTGNICQEAAKRGLVGLDPSLMCCLAEVLTHDDLQDMGMETIVGMHKPMIYWHNELRRLAINYIYEKITLYGQQDQPGVKWSSKYGFAFKVPGNDWYRMYGMKRTDKKRKIFGSEV